MASVHEARSVDAPPAAPQVDGVLQAEEFHVGWTSVRGIQQDLTFEALTESRKRCFRATDLIPVERGLQHLRTVVFDVLDNFWPVSGQLLDNFWNASGQLLCNFSALSEQVLRYVWKVWRQNLDSFCAISEQFMRDL